MTCTFITLCPVTARAAHPFQQHQNPKKRGRRTQKIHLNLILICSFWNTGRSTNGASQRQPPRAGAVSRAPGRHSTCWGWGDSPQCQDWKCLCCSPVPQQPDSCVTALLGNSWAQGVPHPAPQGEAARGVTHAGTVSTEQSPAWAAWEKLILLPRWNQLPAELFLGESSLQKRQRVFFHHLWDLLWVPGWLQL